MSKDKRFVIKISIDEVLMTKRLSRRLFGAVRATEIEEPKKGGKYSRRQKHKNRASDKEALLLFSSL